MHLCANAENAPALNLTNGNFSNLNIIPYLAGEYLIFLCMADNTKKRQTRFVLDGPQISQIYVEENSQIKNEWKTPGKFINYHNFDRTIKITLRKRKESARLIIDDQTIATFSPDNCAAYNQLGLGFKGNYTVKKMYINKLD
jgi:hypothetical protein